MTYSRFWILGVIKRRGLGCTKSEQLWSIRIAKLSGDVEVDETYIGGLETDGKRGTGTENKILVAIAVELVTKIPGKKGRRTMG